jgi:hypothetical protein
MKEKVVEATNKKCWLITIHGRYCQLNWHVLATTMAQFGEGLFIIGVGIKIHAHFVFALLYVISQYFSVARFPVMVRHRRSRWRGEYQIIGREWRWGGREWIKAPLWVLCKVHDLDLSNCGVWWWIHALGIRVILSLSTSSHWKFHVPSRNRTYFHQPRLPASPVNLSSASKGGVVLGSTLVENLKCAPFIWSKCWFSVFVVRSNDLYSARCDREVTLR